MDVFGAVLYTFKSSNSVEFLPKTGSNPKKVVASS
jgi:hypothetical protein